MPHHHERTEDLGYQIPQTIDERRSSTDARVSSLLREDVQSSLTENTDSLKNIRRTLENTARAGLPVNINTVINALQRRSPG